MKKLLLLFSAVICMVCAYAQSVENPLVSRITFNVPDQEQAVDEDGQPIDDTYTVGSVDSTVDITFVGYDSALANELGLTPWLMTLSGRGFTVDPKVELIELDGDTFVYPLNEEWGNPYLGNYYVNLIVCFMDEAGDFYMVDDEPLFYQVVYSTKNTDPATLLGVYPDNKWEKETFAKAYQNGEAFFSFSNIVNFKDETYAGEIVYVFNDGTDNKKVELSMETGNIVADWNPLDGYYQVNVYYDLPGVSADKIASIKISLFDMTSLDQDIDDETLILNNIATLANKAAQTGKSEMSQELISEAEPVEIFNLQGVKVATMTGNSLPNLPQGIYIANGKKIAIK